MLGTENENALAELKKQVQHVVASFSTAAPASDSTILGASQNQHPQRQGTYAYHGQTISSIALDTTSPLLLQDVHDIIDQHHIAVTSSGDLHMPAIRNAGDAHHKSQKQQAHQASKENLQPHDMLSTSPKVKYQAKPFAAAYSDSAKHPVSHTSRKPLQMLSLNNNAQLQEHLEQQVQPVHATSTVSPQDALPVAKYCLPSHGLKAQQTPPCPQQQRQTMQEAGKPSKGVLRSTSQPLAASSDASHSQDSTSCTSSGLDMQKSTAHHPQYSVSTTSITSNSTSSPIAFPAACCCADDDATGGIHIAGQHAARQPSRTTISLASNSSTSLCQPLSGVMHRSLSASRLCGAEEWATAGTLGGQWSNPRSAVAAASHCGRSILHSHAGASTSDPSQRQAHYPSCDGRQDQRGATEHAAAAYTAQGSTGPSMDKPSASTCNVAPASAWNTAVPTMAAPYTSCVVHTPAPFAKVKSIPTGQHTVAAAAATAAAPAAREQRRTTADAVVPAACATQALMSLTSNQQQQQMNELASNTAVGAPTIRCLHGTAAHNSSFQTEYMQASAVPGRAHPVVAAAVAAGGLSTAGIGSTACNSSSGHTGTAGNNIEGRVHAARSQQPQAWQLRQQGMHVGRPGAVSTARSILDPFTASSSGPLGKTAMVQPVLKQTGAEGVGQSRMLAAAAAGQSNSNDNNSKRVLAAVASLAESAFARWRPAHTAAVRSAAAPHLWQGDQHQHKANKLAHWNLAASSMLVAAPDAVKPAGKLSCSIIPPFLQSHAATLQIARPAAAQAYLDPLAAQLQYPSRSGTAADTSMYDAVRGSSRSGTGMTCDAVVPWGKIAGEVNRGSTLLQHMHETEAEQKVQLAAGVATGEQLLEQNLLAGNRLEQTAASLATISSSGSNVCQRLTNSAENTRSHAGDPSASRPLTKAVRRYLEQQPQLVLQQGDLIQQWPVHQQVSGSSSSSASRLTPAHVAAAARALQRLRAHEAREAAAAFSINAATAAAATDTGAKQQEEGAPVCTIDPVAPASCESCAPKYYHMQSLFGNADISSAAAAAHLPASLKGVTAAATAAQAAALQELQVPPHLLVELHLQLRKLTEEHAQAGHDSSSSSSTTARTTSHNCRPLSAAAVSCSVATSASATESSASSASESLHDTAQSTLSYKLPQHLLVRSPYVGLYSSDVDYVATAVRYYHAMANCRDVFYIRHERAVAERQARPGARRMLTWGDKQARHK